MGLEDWPPFCSHRFVHSSQTCCNFTGLLSLVISSDCKKSPIIRFVTTCHLQICYNLLKQLAPSLWITNVDNQLATSLLTTCNGFVVNKLSQAISMRTHYDTDLLTASLLQDVNIFVSVTQSRTSQASLTTCNKLVIAKPEQVMQTHPDISLMTARQQACCRLATQPETRKLQQVCCRFVALPSSSRYQDAFASLAPAWW